MPRYALPENAFSTKSEVTELLRQYRYKNYAQFLQSEHWKKKRAQVVTDETFCCCCAGQATEAHHAWYTKDNLVGFSTVGLYPVCHNCHNEIHRKTNSMVEHYNKFCDMYRKSPMAKRDPYANQKTPEYKKKLGLSKKPRFEQFSKEAFELISKIHGNLENFLQSKAFGSAIRHTLHEHQGKCCCCLTSTGFVYFSKYCTLKTLSGDTCGCVPVCNRCMAMAAQTEKGMKQVLAMAKFHSEHKKQATSP